MSTNDAQASNKAQDAQKSDSVYDFLYYDRQRVAAFLAQFDDSGHLQQVTQRENVSKGGRRGYRLGGGATVMGTGGHLALERTPEERGSQGIERVYDPLWSNALQLLDYLEAADLICRDVNAARLGQFILASGELSVLNPAALSKIWESTGIRQAVAAAAIAGQKVIWNANPANQALPRREKEQAEKMLIKNAENGAKAMLDILPTFPHSAQCTVRGNSFRVWSSLATEGMIGLISDLTLKHGTEVPGKWNMLGILDATPSAIPAQVIIPYTGVPSHFEDMIRNFANLARTALGRPPDAHGATPLLLFREVSPG